MFTKDSIQPSSKIYVSTSLIPGAGRGVFVAEAIKNSERIECVPVMIIPAEQIFLLDQTDILNYYFAWGNKEGAFALGYGTLYNHSYQPNAIYNKIFECQLLEFIAIKDINSEEEITVNYNGDPNDQSPIDWMKSIPLPTV